MAIGDITAKDRLVRLNVGNSGKWCLANNNYWILAYNKDGSNSITVETYHVHPKGVISTIVDTKDFASLKHSPRFAKQISPGVVAIWGTNGDSVGGDGKIITIAVSSTGIINASILGSLVWRVADDAFESIAHQYDAVNTSGIYWASPFRWGRYNGGWTYTWRLAVVSISLDGTTLSSTDDDQISTHTASTRSNIKAVSETIVAVSVDAGKVITVDINTSGIITDAGVDSTIFGGSRPWIEKLDNGWWVMAYGTGNGKLGSFKITNAGIIDNAFTHNPQFLSAGGWHTTVFNLGGVTTGYIVINVRTSGLNSFLVTLSCDSNGSFSSLQSLEWETISLYSGSMAKVAYNMFLVEGDTSSGQDIYSETIQVEAPGLAFPSRAITRVTGIRHTYRAFAPGQETYNILAILGGISVFTDYQRRGKPTPTETPWEPAFPYGDPMRDPFAFDPTYINPADNPDLPQ